MCKGDTITAKIVVQNIANGELSMLDVNKTGTDAIHQSMVETTWNILSYNLHSAGPPETANVRR